MNTAARHAVLQEYCRELKVPMLFRQHAELARQARDGGWAYEDFLLQLVEAECQARRDHTAVRRLREARFPELKTFEQLDWSHRGGTCGAGARLSEGSCRVGSWIVLALTYRDLGDRERPRAILARIIALAPPLALEVTRASASPRVRALLEPDVGLARLTDDEVREVLETALAAMRGNRSAGCLTFVDSRRQLCAIPPNRFHRFVQVGDEVAAFFLNATREVRRTGPGPSRCEASSRVSPPGRRRSLRPERFAIGEIPYREPARGRGWLRRAFVQFSGTGVRRARKCNPIPLSGPLRR